MITWVPKALALIGIVLGLAQPVSAQQATRDVDLSQLDLDDRVVRMVQNDPVSSLERYLLQFFSIATNGSLSADDIELRRRMGFARRRAQEVSQAMLLDLNGDAEISEAEIDRQRAVLKPAHRAQMLVLLTYGDTNRDRKLSYAEVTAFVDRKMERGGAHLRGYDDLMRFDLDGNGAVIAWEIIQAVQAIEVQAGGPGASGPDRDAPRLFSGCGYRKMSDGESLMLVSAEVGAGLSDVTLTTADEATTVATLVIERGREPLTLMLLNRTPMIWRLRGQVERIRKVIVSDETTGVVGVASERLQFVPHDRCLPTAFARGADKLKETARVQLSAVFGHPAPTVMALRKALPIGVPSGRMLDVGLPDLPEPQIQIRGGISYVMTPRGMVAIDGPNADLRQAALVALDTLIRRQYPAGLHRFSDGGVQSAGPQRRTVGVPGRMGLAEALENGRLEALPGNRFRITPSFIRFPEGLPAGRFVLPAGVAVPKGISRHIEVRAEANGACIAGSTCPR